MAVVGLTALMAQQTHDIKGVVTDKRNESADIKKVIAESIGLETVEAKKNHPVMMATPKKRLSFVVEAGLDWSRYTIEGADAKIGYHIGVGMEVRMSKRWAFRPMVQLANRGSEYNYSDAVYSYKETWNPMMLDVPLMFLVRYEVAHNMNFVLSFGPVFSWGLSGKVKVSETGKGNAEYDIYKKEYPSNWGGPDHALLHPLGFGMGYGIGLEYKKMLISFTGKNMALFTEDDGIADVTEHNFVFGASVSYRF